MQAFLAEAVADADGVTFWVSVAIAATVAAILLRRGRDALWRLRLIVDTPTARIRSAPQGYVELQGTAAPVRGLVAGALTGKPCVWYRWRVEQYRRSGRSGNWVTLEQGSAERPFLVDDGTGQAEVSPDAAALHLRTRERWQGPHPRAGRGQSNAIAAFFARQRRYRMSEERIVNGEPVYILGRFETPRRGVREREALTRTLLSQWKRDPERMRGLDRNNDGTVDLAEWEHARSQAARLAERAEAKLRSEPPRPRVGPTGEPSHPFVVSTVDEPNLLRKLRLAAFGGMSAGALLSGGTIAAVLARFAI
jgi:hypothetical protein